MKNNTKTLLLLLLIITLVFSLLTIFIYSDSPPSVSARAAALYDPFSEKFIYTKNEYMHLGMASTTKILTAHIALNELDTEEPITIDKRATGIEGSSIYLKEGEILTVMDLIYATLLQSANDAAAALAYRISGELDLFAEKMNLYAYELGLENSNFENPHGLDSKNHYTCAHDLAIIASEAMKDDRFREIAATKTKKIESSDCTRTLKNHNKLLSSYEGCIGIKTGYTKKTGRSLVSAAERDGLTLIAVTIDAPDDWRDHKSLLDYAYSLFEMRRVVSEKEFTYDLPVLDGTAQTVTVSNAEGFSRVTYKSTPKFNCELHLPRYLVAPINEGDVVGQIIIKEDQNEIYRIDVTASESVEKESFISKYFNKDKYG